MPKRRILILIAPKEERRGLDAARVGAQVLVDDFDERFANDAADGLIVRRAVATVVLVTQSIGEAFRADPVESVADGFVGLEAQIGARGFLIRHARRVRQRQFDEAIRVLRAEHQPDPPAERVPDQEDALKPMRVEVSDDELRVVRYTPGARGRLASAETGQIEQVGAVTER